MRGVSLVIEESPKRNFDAEMLSMSLVVSEATNLDVWAVDHFVENGTVCLMYSVRIKPREATAALLSFL